jgi:hypothetical protein
MGEYVTDDRVWIVKAHHPGLIPKNLQLISDKVLCCVRNPLDIIMSLACFSNTMNHSVKPDFEVDEIYPDYWDWFIRYQTECMRRWFEIIIDHTDN